jgi:nicotinate-nucleotide adenylyltransferase
VKLGLFGGTFDPPHVGHLIVAQDVLSALRLDRVVFVPAAQPPHKRRSDLTPADIRLAMLRAALAGDDRFEIDDLELHRAGPSYTVDTLRLYRGRLPDATLHLLVGADQFAEFETWHLADVIRSLAVLCVLARGGPGAVGGEGEGVVHVPVTRIDLSSTAIRRRVGAGESIRYLVPVAVERIIRGRGLYAGAG